MRSTPRYAASRSRHKALYPSYTPADLHRARKEAADRAFVAQHGPDATIRYDEDLGRWQVEAAETCAATTP